MARLILALSMILLIAGCTQEQSLNNTVLSAQDNQVTINSYQFIPSNIEINAGESITWINQESAGHTIVSDTGAFSSNVLGNGDNYTYTFTQAGTYAYHCSIHPSMHGTVSVS